VEIRLITAEQAKAATDQELFDRISSDYLSYEEWQPSDSWIYIGFFDGDILGYVMLHPENESTMYIHINVLKEHRGRGYEIAKRGLKAINESLLDRYRKFICKIPVVYPSVYHFAKTVGFLDEGLCTKSIMKGGVLVDQYMLGLERNKT